MGTLQDSRRPSAVNLYATTPPQDVEGDQGDAGLLGRRCPAAPSQIVLLDLLGLVRLWTGSRSCVITCGLILSTRRLPSTESFYVEWRSIAQKF